MLARSGVLAVTHVPGSLRLRWSVASAPVRHTTAVLVSPAPGLGPSVHNKMPMLLT